MAVFAHGASFVVLARKYTLPVGGIKKPPEN
jgi:hypothetical protein